VRRSFAVVVLALLLLAGTTGCGSAGPSPVVVRVGTAKIDRATVDHWTRAIALGSTVEGVTGRSSSTPRQKALEFLISADWAIGAAADHGLVVSEDAVERGLKERIEAAPNGRGEFEEEISATGQTLADVKLEVKASLASARLRESLTKRVSPVTQAQIADYYKHHLQSFRIPDRRWVDLIEEIHGYAHAVALGKRLGSEARFRKRAMRELVTRDTPYEDAHHDWKAPMLHAIFATPLGRVGGPVSFHYMWVLFVVRKRVPGSVKPLSEVSAEISERLSEERHRRALASFLETYRREWTAKTSCRAGFVVQKCSGYRGQLVSEGNRVRAAFLTRWTSRWKARTDCRAGYVVDSCRQHSGPPALEYPISADL
jgi:hypothetical protein